MPPALQQRLWQHQQQQQHQAQPDEPTIHEEELPATPTGSGSSRIPVRTLKAERRALAAAARQAGISVEEYVRQLEEEQEQEQQLERSGSPTTPTTPTGKSRAMMK